jgi:CpeT/CpcT family (DUF1001)
MKRFCKHIFLIGTIVLLTAGCHNIQKIGADTKDAALENFARLMIGQFSSRAQSIRDTSYFNIALSMSRIWVSREDGIWLYVEQAMASQMDKPYRQRVYRLTHPSKDTYVSDVYTIKGAADVIGLRNDVAKQQLLTFDKIEIKEGCSVVLTQRQGVYEGGTVADHCPSELRGAKYATTKILLKSGELYSWDQGFDASGKQVWGATKGGYVFVKE